MLTKCSFRDRPEFEAFIGGVSSNCRRLDSLVIFKCKIYRGHIDRNLRLLSKLRLTDLKILSIINGDEEKHLWFTKIDVLGFLTYQRK